jgi:hypothetical protein
MGKDSAPLRSSQFRVTMLVEKSLARLRTPDLPVRKSVFAILVVTASNRLFKTARVMGSRVVVTFALAMFPPL